MHRVGWMTAILLVGIGLSACADCGCTPPGSPACYTLFRANQTIEFTLTVPVDYFTAHATEETPFITGWRVETVDGVLVRRVTFDFPHGLLTVMEWTLKDDDGVPVNEGFYRIIVETTSAGEISNTVQLIPCCGACVSSCRSPVCRPACGEAYLILRVGDSFRCGCGLSLFGSWSFGTP